MKHKLIGVASFALLFAPALVMAAENAPYIGLYGGLNLQDDADISANGVSGEADTDSGYVFGGTLGYAFHPGAMWSVRTELDIGYRENDIESLSGTIAGLGSGSISNVDGDISIFSGLVNVWWDYNAGRFTPYFGGGIGAANVSVNDVSVFGVGVADDSETVLAYQFGAGLAYAISDSMDISFDYRYFATDDAELSASAALGGGEFDIDTGNHSIMLGLRHSF